MEQAVNLWPLIGIAAIVVGFVLRFNPVLVVIAAGIITGLAALMPLDVILEKLGEGFLNTRNLPLILLLPLPIIGLLGVSLDIENYCTLRLFFDLSTLAGLSRRNLPEAGIRLLFHI